MPPNAPARAFPILALSFVVLWSALSLSCGPEAPPVVTPIAPVAAPATWEQKLAWIVRLEDQRLLREPNPPPPPMLRAPAGNQPGLIGPAAPADLLELLRDKEPRVRRRAALAVGRVGLSNALPNLAERLSDEEPEVRQMAAFALGLIGDPAARGALLQALTSPDPILQGRAAEALGLLGDKDDALAIGAMLATHVRGGALGGVSPDDLTYPMAPPIEAVRLGLYALARLGAYEPLAEAVLDGGQPVSRWWPIAYALQRVGDARAAPALSALAGTPGRYTASFAVRGLAGAKATQEIPRLRTIVEERRLDAAVVLQAVRGLAALGDVGALPLLLRVVADGTRDARLRAEAMTAFATLCDEQSAEVLTDLLVSPDPFVRAQATRALARVAPQVFTLTLSGLDSDPDWTVRAAQAAALGSLPDGAGVARLTLMADDTDPRVVPAVMAALVSARAPRAKELAQARLQAKDFRVRAAAAQALVDLKAVDAVPALWAAYQAAAAEATYVARGAMLTAVHRLDPQGARTLLESALTDRDWALRVRAADLVKESGAVDGVPERMRPAAAGADPDSPEWRALVSPPFSPRAFIETDKGTIEIELAVLDAPLTVRNFMTLARKGFFNGVTFHRVVGDFVIQGGDPGGDGEGGPGYTLRDEINQRPYLRGVVGMALDWRDTGGSQFFITHSPAPHLDGRYTVFGHVVEGMDIVDQIQPGDRIQRVRIRDGVTEP
jgi:cyclophilin family peptidyl-prolyl cis-trans isomerase/HEAT repeat protein